MVLTISTESQGYPIPVLHIYIFIDEGRVTILQNVLRKQKIIP